MKDRQIKIFVDFDGTISTEDVGEKLFIETIPEGKVFPILEDIKTKSITAREGWNRLFQVAEGLTRNKVAEIARTISLEKGVNEFLAYCSEQQFDVYILSDGFEEYIEPILGRHGITGIPLFANRLADAGNGRLSPVFPWTDEECPVCANCKRNHLISNSADDDVTVYIGNGSSDTCPVGYADYVFAKDYLLKYCEKERITFFPYKDFNDIRKRFTELADGKKMKKRHRAETLRKQLYKLG